MKYLRPILLILLATFALAAQVKSGIPDPIDVLANPDSSQLFGTSLTTVFTKLDFPALDIGCGSEGDVCAVGINKKLYCYDLVQNKWDLIQGNEEISDIVAVDVDDEGKIYIIATCGIYYLDCTDKWVRLPGTGKDIGVGANFDVWKIGSDQRNSKTLNFGVWKLFCECDCNCICIRICIRFRKLSFNICDPVSKRRCHWFRAGVYGVAIDVFPNGDAAVVKDNGTVHIADGVTFEISAVPGRLPQKAVDITVGNNGVMYVTIANGEIYKYNFTTKTWTKVTQATIPAFRICASAYDIPWYTKLDSTDANKFILTAAIHDYI